MNKTLLFANCLLICSLTYGQSNVVASFMTPDTVCVNAPVNITNTSSGATSYYWNFCVADINQAPAGNNIGNAGGYLNGPVFMDYVNTNNNYYGFVTNHSSGTLTRLDFGNSLLNTPTAVDLGNYGGILQPTSALEGIQMVQNEGKWYAIIVAGYTPDGSQPRIVKIDFGTNITSAGVATNWGNLGNLSRAIDLHIFKEGNNWYGFTVNAENNTFTRFDFTNSFDNTPTAINLGNIGNLNYPTGIYAINDNGFWRVFITNGGGYLSGANSSITRLDFGSSLLNTPTAVNVGNPGDQLQHPRDFTLMKFCGQITGFAVNGRPGYDNIVRLNFNNNLADTPTITPVGNIGNLNFPHSISKLFRVNDDVYAFITNVSNNTITRLRFQGCTNASVPGSNLQHPAPVTYSTPGTYNINLTLDDGLPTQTSYCKQVVVTGPPVINLGNDTTLCAVNNLVLDAGNTGSIFKWQDGSTEQTFTATTYGKYYVSVTSVEACTSSDTIVLSAPTNTAADFYYKQDVCNPLLVQFFSNGTNITNPYWSFGDGNIITGNFNPSYTYPAFSDYTVKFGFQNGNCNDSIIKTIPIRQTYAELILTPDTTICFNTTKQLRAQPALSYCWSPTTYLNNPNAQNPVTNTPRTITYYLNSEVTGNSLVVNGDFSNGNTGFTSSYTYSNSGWPTGVYFVGNNTQSWHPNMQPCKDHTTGTGNMLLVNGAEQPNVTVWSQTITVTPNTNYAFSAWLQHITTINPARLQFSINGNPLGNIFQANNTSCIWDQFYTVWNSGNNTNATIAIVNQNTVLSGNDFALDDISFAPVLIKRDSVIISVDSPVVTTNNDTTVCKNALVQLQANGGNTWSWSPPAGLSDALISNPVATPATATQYIVTGTTVNGCVAKDTVTINLYPAPTVLAAHDILICPNTSVQLFANTGMLSYAWSPAATLNNAAIAAPAANPVSNIVYKVQGKDANNCDYIDSVSVQLRSFSFAASGDQAVCKGSTVVLKATGGNIYEWAPSGSLDNASSASPVASPDTNTIYTVHITESTCLHDTTINLPVTVNPAPVVRAGKTNDINCSSPNATLNAIGAVSYSWYPVTGLDYPDMPNPVAGADTTTTYFVKGTNQYGCSAIDSITVYVTTNGKVTFTLPNSFTPNGDGRNDCFGIKKLIGATIEEFSIFNRWGERVFTSKNPNACWDGNYKGHLASPGGYAYIIKAKTICGTIKRSGVVMLIR